MGIFNEIKYLSEFGKELEKLSKKRFRSLPEDLETFINTPLNLYHKLKTDYDGIIPIADLGVDYPSIYKVTKFACRALKGRGVKSGIRLTYAYYQEEDIIEFIEIYFKGDKEHEDKERIRQLYLKER